MKAGDLTPGRYYAHKEVKPTCYIHSVTYDPTKGQVLIDYTYPRNKRYQHWYHPEREWSVVPEEHIIENAEDIDWLALLEQP